MNVLFLRRMLWWNHNKWAKQSMQINEKKETQKKNTLSKFTSFPSRSFVHKHLHINISSRLQEWQWMGHPSPPPRKVGKEWTGWTIPVCQMYKGLVSTAVCASSSQMKRKSSAILQRERSGAPLETPSIPTALPASPMATARQVL